MYVRLGFAVAVMVRPEILIVDEVIAVGDEEFQRKCYDYLYDLRRAGTSMIVVSHGLGQIKDLCDEALWLERGTVKKNGGARAVTRAYIDSVNQHEAERAAEAAASQPGVTGIVGLGRRGSGEVRVREVQFLDESGDPRGVLVSGRRAGVRLHYDASRDVRGVILGLGFDDSTGRVICGMNNSHGRFDWVRAGSGYMDFIADPLLLAEGVYRMRFELRSAGSCD